MSFSPALIYDFLFLAIFSFAAVKSWQKGFLAGLTELVGAVLGVGVAVWGSRTLAPEVYTRFFSDSVTARVNEAVAQSGGDIAAACSSWISCPSHCAPLPPTRCRPPEISCPKSSPPCWSRCSCRLCRSCFLCCSAWSCAGVRPAGPAAARRQCAAAAGRGQPPARALSGPCHRRAGLLACGAGLWFAAGITAGKFDWLTLAALQQSIGYSFFGAFNPFLVHY